MGSMSITGPDRGAKVTNDEWRPGPQWPTETQPRTLFYQLPLIFSFPHCTPTFLPLPFTQYSSTSLPVLPLPARGQRPETTNSPSFFGIQRASNLPHWEVVRFSDFQIRVSLFPFSGSQLVASEILNFERITRVGITDRENLYLTSGIR
jgi:hypothetical protein